MVNTQARATRKNLFLSAQIEAGALKAPVRIRNLSESGAMIEGAALPNPGTQLTLHRLEMEIGALVVWQTAGRCGVQFDGKISIDDWVAGVRKPASQLERGQARVDAIQAAIRSGGSLPPETNSDHPASVRAAELDRRIADELAYVKRVLDGIGDELTDDPIMLQRHANTLQSFDLACQIIDHLSIIIGAEDRAAAVGTVSLQELRNRLLRKAVF